MDNSIETKPPRLCKNCGSKLSKRGKFCPGCGQRDFDGRIRMRELLSKFFSNITHLDNKFVTMAWQLLIPAKVTLQYFQGKIKRYPHPVQFFFIVMFFFLLMFRKQLDGVAMNLFGGSIDIGSEATYSSGNGAVVVSKSNIYDALKRCMVAREYRSAYDSLPPEWQTAATRQTLDSIHQLVSAPWEESTSLLLRSLADDEAGPPSNLDSVSLSFGTTVLRISTPDFVDLAPDSIIRKYRYYDWFQQITIRQGIKAIKDQKGLINSAAGSFGWAVLVLIAWMSLVLWLLYYRRGRYYVEHFIFLMHQQSGAFLFLTLALLIGEYLHPLEWAWLGVLGWLGLAPLLAMKRFYRENWGHSIWKWLVFILLYTFSLLLFFISTLLVVFVVF